MTDISAALKALGIGSYVIRGDKAQPENETEFNQMFFKVTGVDSGGGSIESNNPSDFGVTWSQVSAKITELQNAEPMRLLREQRNLKLKETDWWAGADLTMTQAQTDYRQALRDITETYTSVDDVVWPVKP